MIKFLKGFGYAAAGIYHGFNERNFRVHICAVLFVTWFALKFYELSRAEWAVLLLTFAAVGMTVLLGLLIRLFKGYHDIAEHYRVGVRVYLVAVLVVAEGE